MHQSVLFVDNRLLSVHLQRQGLCFEKASQHCCASGLGHCATSIGAVRRQGGSAHAYHSGERPRRVFRPRSIERSARRAQLLPVVAEEKL